MRVIIESNFLEQFERVSGLILDTGPCGFLGFWSGVIFPLPTDAMVVLVSNVLLMQSAYKKGGGGGSRGKKFPILIFQYVIELEKTGR